MKRLSLVSFLTIFHLSAILSQMVENDVTMVLDEAKQYPFYYKESTLPHFQDFTISPTKENTIWFGDSFSLKYELNLVTGVFSKIEEVLGFKLNTTYGISSRLSKQDPYDYDTFWIYLNGTGFIKYSKSLKKQTLFKIDSVRCIAISKDIVSLGVGKGFIYSIDKLTDSVKIIDTKLGDFVEQIYYEESKRYIINERYHYYPEDESITTIPSSEQTKFLPDRFRNPKHWLTPNGHFDQVNQGEEVLFYKYNQMYCYDTVSGMLSKINYRPNTDIRKLKTDENYLFLLGKWEFTMVNRKFLLVNSQIQEPENTKELRLFKLEMRSFNVSWNESYNEAIDKLDYLNIKYSNSTNKYIIDKLEQQNNRLINLVRNDRFRSIAQNKIETDSIKSDYLEPILFSFLTFFYKKAQIDSVLYYDSIFTSRFPDSKRINEKYTNSLKDSKEVKQNLMQLDSLNVPGDEYLWEKAEICKKLVGNNWGCGNVSCNSEIYLQFYRKLINDFPNSEYIDDVEFRLLRYHEGSWRHEGERSKNLELIEEYNTFLEKYPNTKYEPDVLFQLASLYSSAVDSWNRLYEYNKTALEMYYRIQDEFPDYQNIYLPRCIEEIKRDLPLLGLNLSLISDKEIYSEDEPIYITIGITNKLPDSSSIMIKCLDSIPMAFLDIYKERDNSGKIESYKFQEIKSYRDSLSKPLYLASNESRSEKWDITKYALKWSYQFEEYPLGYFDFPKGKYRITAYSYPWADEFHMHSEPIFIEIR